MTDPDGGYCGNGESDRTDGAGDWIGPDCDVANGVDDGRQDAMARETGLRGGDCDGGSARYLVPGLVHGHDLGLFLSVVLAPALAPVLALALALEKCQRTGSQQRQARWIYVK